MDDYFDTLPMVIVETSEEGLSIVRGNKSFKEFAVQNFGEEDALRTYDFANANATMGVYTVNTIRKCGLDGKRVIIDDRLNNGKTVQLLIQRIAVNQLQMCRQLLLSFFR